MKLLRMRENYIEWTRQGCKTATTRTKNKGLGDFELVSGSRYKPKKSGVVVAIYSIQEWTRASITESQRKKILEAENFTDWNTFIAILEELNGKKIGINEVLYTHFYKVI